MSKTEPLTELSRRMAEMALEVLETYVYEIHCHPIIVTHRAAAVKVLARAFQETERLAREDLLAALEAAHAVMDAADARGIADWLTEGPARVWAEAHAQVREALKKARGTNG